MKRGVIMLGLSIAASGCSGMAFRDAGPAVFREPAAQMAHSLRGVSVQPALLVRVPAESLHDVRIFGERALFDYRSESVDTGVYSGQTCGPLELRDVTQNQRVWSIERARSCDDTILSVAPRLAILGMREEAGKSGLYLSTLALNSGEALAELALEKGALAVPSGDAFLVVQGEAGKQRVSLHDGDKLDPRWTLALGDAGAVSKAITLSGTILLFGGSVTAIDRASGAKLRSSSLGTRALAVDVLTTDDTAYALIVRGKAETAVAKVGVDGSVVWTSDTKGLLDQATARAAFLVDKNSVIALRSSDGAVAWSGKLPAVATGRGLIVPQGENELFLVPHDNGVTAFDAATGALRFSVSPFDTGDGEPHATDRLSLSAEGLVILDTARGVAGLDLENEGKARYAIAVRSLPYVHRRGRMRAAFGKYDVDAMLAAVQERMDTGSANLGSISGLSSVTGGGFVSANAQISMAFTDYAATMGALNFATMMASIVARYAQHADIAMRQVRIDEESAFILRPISWATGRGLLVVRKSDGAFREIVTGPPDMYEDPFRAASVAALVPLAKVIMTFSEGVDPSTWEDSPRRPPVQLVARSLLGYALDEPSFHPASEYPQRSVVPISD